jgi:hypothetical protein
MATGRAQKAQAASKLMVKARESPRIPTEREFTPAMGHQMKTPRLLEGSETERVPALGTKGPAKEAAERGTALLALRAPDQVLGRDQVRREMEPDLKAQLEATRRLMPRRHMATLTEYRAELEISRGGSRAVPALATRASQNPSILRIRICRPPMEPSLLLPGKR